MLQPRCARGVSSRNRVDDQSAPSRLSDDSPFEPSCKLAPMIETIQFGTLEGPIVRLPGRGSHVTGRGFADTTVGIVPVAFKHTPHHQLVREVLCNLLAQMVGIPVPTPCVLDIRESELWDGGDSFVFATRYAGYSDLLQRTRESPTVVDRLVSWPSFLVSIAFDEWIANEDRTLSNLLFAGRREFLLIDHGEALPNHMDKGTKFRNSLARHLIASEPRTARQSLARRVKDSCTSFGQLNYGQLETAALLGAWKGNPEFGECMRLLQDRVNELPALIEEEFHVGQAQLLA